MSFISGIVTLPAKVSGNKGQDHGRPVLCHRVLDAVEIGPIIPPVILVPRHHNALIGLELDKFERPGADRVTAHVARRYMAGIDRREPRGEQREETRLRPLQMEGDLEVPVGGDLFEVPVPGLARIDAQLLAGVAGQQIPGTFDVFGGERLAVVPFHTLAQREAQLGTILAPRPAGRQIRQDPVEGVLLYVLVEQNEIIEYRHHRALGVDRRFLVYRHARRAVDHVLSENPARLLGYRRAAHR